MEFDSSPCVFRRFFKSCTLAGDIDTERLCD